MHDTNNEMTYISAAGIASCPTTALTSIKCHESNKNKTKRNIALVFS